MQFGLEYDRRLAYNGDYTVIRQTVAMFRLWWSVERERQLLQNLNMSGGASCRSWGLARRLNRLEAERRWLDWALEKAATFYEWQGPALPVKCMTFLKTMGLMSLSQLILVPPSTN